MQIARKKSRRVLVAYERILAGSGAKGMTMAGGLMARPSGLPRRWKQAFKHLYRVLPH